MGALLVELEPKGWGESNSLMSLPPILVSQESLTLGQPLRSASSTCGILLVFYLNGFFKGYKYSWFLKVRKVFFVIHCLLFAGYSSKVKAQVQSQLPPFWKGHHLLRQDLLPTQH